LLNEGSLKRRTHLGTPPLTLMPRISIIPSFELESGDVLNNITVGYERWGTLNDTGDNVIVVGHSLTSSPNAQSWWSGCVGPGKALDTDKYFVVCANVIGSPYGTVSPISVNPSTGKAYGLSLPQATIRDTVRLHKVLLDRLGVQKIAFAIGGSMGGMQVLEWAQYGSDYIRGMVPIAVGARHSSWCIGWSEAQRQAIYADPDWNDGMYDLNAPPTSGLAAARMMAMVSYRSFESFEAKFGRDKNQHGSFQTATWLQHHGDKLVNRFDPSCYVYLTRLMDTHDISHDGFTYQEVLASLDQHALVIGIRSDILYPLQEQEELYSTLPQANLEILEGPHGHDSFLIDQDELNDLVLHWRQQQIDPLIDSSLEHELDCCACT